MWRGLRRLLALGPRVVALAVLIAAMLVAPVRVPAEPEECCCPVPAECKCPDHQPPGDASIRRCSQPTPQVVPAPVPVAELPAPIVLTVDVTIVHTPAIVLPAPHRTPDVERPRGPS